MKLRVITSEWGLATLEAKFNEFSQLVDVVSADFKITSSNYYVFVLYKDKK